MAEPGGDAASIANTPWWEPLKDQELQKLIRRRWRKTKTSNAPRRRSKNFRRALFIAKTDYAPQMNVTANAPLFGRKSNFLFPGFPNPFNYYLQGNLSWEIDIWGRIRRSNEAARAISLSREENRRAIVLQLVSGVAEAYFDLLQFDMQLDIAHRTLKSWEESVRIAQARLRQGMISKLDADQFEAERANAAAKAAEFERQRCRRKIS